MATETQLQAAAAQVALARVPISKAEAVNLLAIPESDFGTLVATGRLKGRTSGGVWTTTIGNVIACAAGLRGE
jgi:hypothetical protein